MDTANLSAWQNRLSPLVHLTNNWLSLIGVLLVTTAGIFWLFLLPRTFQGHPSDPYLGILAFLILPAFFFLGLLLIPAGIWRKRAADKRSGRYPENFPPLTLQNVDFRRLLTFVAVTTVANLVIASHLTYGAVTYMESVTFCGQACHTVMEPEFTAYQNSPHSRVECVKCHIGPGASWFVRSKLDGVYQVFAVAFNIYPRPIPTPVHSLRPARETCEACHWPQKYGQERLRVITKFGEDEKNSRTRSVLLMKIGGGVTGAGIHGAHFGEGVRIRYAHSDEKRQVIPWVEHSVGKQTTIYKAKEHANDSSGTLPVREMDCMDCHTRPSHAFDMPDRAVNQAMAAGRISRALPGIRKLAVEVLKQPYPNRQASAAGIPRAVAAFYEKTHPAVYQDKRAEIEQAGRALVGILHRNVFPEMRITWGTYPNNIGHEDFPGCFRCHDDLHASSGQKKITQDCNACHSLLAMDEAEPKILGELGVE